MINRPNIFGVVLIVSVALAILTIFMAPRCGSKDGGIMIGGMLVGGCK